jgi:hypothetical protein
MKSCSLVDGYHSFEEICYLHLLCTIALSPLKFKSGSRLSPSVVFLSGLHQVAQVACSQHTYQVVITTNIHMNKTAEQMVRNTQKRTEQEILTVQEWCTVELHGTSFHGLNTALFRRLSQRRQLGYEHAQFSTHV